MNNDLQYDCLAHNCSKKITEAINKYSFTTSNIIPNKKLDIIRQNGDDSDKTIPINNSSDAEIELKTYSSIVIDNINSSINKKDSYDKNCKHDYIEKLKENKNFKNPEISTILNFIMEHNKINTKELNKNIIQNIKITEEIKKTKDMNDLMRKIEHEEIKELISLNLKLFLIEIKKIYHTLNDINCRDSNENNKLDYSIRASEHNCIENRTHNRKKHNRINGIIKKYIILKKYYKKLCKKYKEENNILKKIFFHNNNTSYLNKKYQEKRCSRNLSQSSSIHEDLKNKNKKNNSSNSVIYKDYSNNILFKKYILNEKEDNKIIQDILKKNKKLQLHLKKYHLGYESMYNKKSLKRWINKKKKLSGLNNENFSIPKNRLNYYHSSYKPINLTKKKNEADEYSREIFSYKKNYIGKRSEILISKKNENAKYSEEKLDLKKESNKGKLRKDNELNKKEKKIIENNNKSDNKHNDASEKKQEEKEEEKSCCNTEKNKSENVIVHIDNDKISNTYKIMENKEKKNVENQFSCSLKKRNKYKNNNKKEKKVACKFKHTLKNRNNVESENINENEINTQFEREIHKNKNNCNENKNKIHTKIECNKKGEIIRLNQEKEKRNLQDNKENEHSDAEKEKRNLQDDKKNTHLDEEKEKRSLQDDKKNTHSDVEKEKRNLQDDKKNTHSDVEKEKRNLQDDKKNTHSDVEKEKRNLQDDKKNTHSDVEKEKRNLQDEKKNTHLDEEKEEIVSQK